MRGRLEGKARAVAVREGGSWGEWMLERLELGQGEGHGGS